jgi:hypothetical protein
MRWEAACLGLRGVEAAAGIMASSGIARPSDGCQAGRYRWRGIGIVLIETRTVSQSVSQSVSQPVSAWCSHTSKAQDESKGESSQSGLAAARQNQSDEGGAYKIDPPPLSFSARPTTKLRRARCFCSLPPLFFFAVYTTSPTTHRRLLHIMAVRAQFENSNEYVLRGAGGVVFGMAKVANGGAESVSSRHLPTHTQLLPLVHPRTSTGTGSKKQAKRAAY